MTSDTITGAERAAMDRLIAAARSFVDAADEFWPEYPSALDERLAELFLAVEAVGDAPDVHEGPENKETGQ